MNPSTKIIVFSNHKGGCGKTSSIVNLAGELGRLGYKILVVDLDAQANASLHIGKLHPSEVKTTAADLLLSKENLLSQAIHEDTYFENVHLIYGDLSLNAAEDKLKDIAPRPNEELEYKLRPLQGLYDVILIDTPPSLRGLTFNALAAATHLVIPIESGSQYGMYGVADLLAIVHRFQETINPKLNVLGVLLIRHDNRLTVCKLIEAIAEQQVGKLLPLRISTSTKVNQAAMLHKTVYGLDPASRVGREFKDFAHYIAEELGLEGKNNGK